MHVHALPPRHRATVHVLASGHRQTPAAFRARRVAVAATPDHLAAFAETTRRTVERYEEDEPVAWRTEQRLWNALRAIEAFATDRRHPRRWRSTPQS